MRSPASYSICIVLSLGHYTASQFALYQGDIILLFLPGYRSVQWYFSSIFLNYTFLFVLYAADWRFILFKFSF